MLILAYETEEIPQTEPAVEIQPNTTSFPNSPSSSSPSTDKNKNLVAIKKVLQDKRFKNRELTIMRDLKHCNIVQLKYFFYSMGDKREEVYLNLILEYVPETVYRVSRHYAKAKQPMPIS